MNRSFAIVVLVVAALAGCGKRAAPPDARSETTAPPTDTWVGEWTGPEGTALAIAGENGAYTLTIRNLDGPRTFKGTADGDTIRFERDGKSLALRAGNGEATGMKWLADKTDCVLVAAGEGWCRD